MCYNEKDLLLYTINILTNSKYHIISHFNGWKFDEPMLCIRLLCYNLLDEYDSKKIYNYCPFIKSDASCSVYEQRPPICKEFSTMPGKINECPEKASRLDILKFILKSFF